MLMREESNALFIHGGGLVDASKEVIVRIAEEIFGTNTYDNLFIGRYSFMSLYDLSFQIPYLKDTAKKMQDVRGTYLGTCRGIDLTNPELLRQATEVLKYQNVKSVIVCGGDGSSRNCDEIHEEFRKNDISLIFAVPLTVDGINGSWSIGLDQAVRECVRQIENVAATSLETRDNGNFSVVAVELQGRNRDDILATTLQQLHRQGRVADCNLEDILIRVVPANYETNELKLLDEIRKSEKRTLVLVSEGAHLKVSKLQENMPNRKVRTVTVGHSVQSNGMTTEEDMQKYSEWLTDVANIIKADPFGDYCIVNDGISRWKEPIDYFAKLNPRNGQKATLSKGLELLMKEYMAN